MKNIRVASVQFEHSPESKQANLKKVESFVREAARQDVAIIVFPECCICGYWHLRHLSRERLTVLAEPVFSGPSSQALISLSKKHRITIGAGLVEITENQIIYNTYLVIMPNGDCQRHRKLHAFISEYMTSGSEYTVFDTPHGCRLGILTCYDNNISENVRITALKGAEILLAPHQTGGCDIRNPHVMGKVDRSLWDNRKSNQEAIEAEFRGPKGRGWLMRWLPTRAHDNGIFVIFSNGVGIDDDEIRTGNAMVIDPYGRILAETWKAEDKMVIADLDASLLDLSTGRQWIMVRRPELYGPLTVATGFEQNTRTVRFGMDKGGC